MRPYVFMLALIVLLLGACQPVVAPTSAAPEMTEEEAFLAAVWEAEEAFAAGDIDRMLEAAHLDKQQAHRDEEPRAKQ